VGVLEELLLLLLHAAASSRIANATPRNDANFSCLRPNPAIRLTSEGLLPIRLSLGFGFASKSNRRPPASDRSVQIQLVERLFHWRQHRDRRQHTIQRFNDRVDHRCQLPSREEVEHVVSALP